MLKDAIEKTYVPHLQDVVFEGESVDPPTQLSWYAPRPMYHVAAR